MKQTDYQLRISLAVPEAHIPDANQLALCTGPSPDDDKTFKASRYKDASGTLYSLASTVVVPSYIDVTTSELVAPAHSPDVDLEAAKRAQALLVIEDRTNGGDPVTVSPDHIAVIIDHRLADVPEHIAALGLVAAVSEDEPI